MKDTSGPSLNILIKLMAITSLVFGRAFVEHGGLLLPYIDSKKTMQWNLTVLLTWNRLLKIKLEWYIALTKPNNICLLDKTQTYLKHRYNLEVNIIYYLIWNIIKICSKL